MYTMKLGDEWFHPVPTNNVLNLHVRKVESFIVMALILARPLKCCTIKLTQPPLLFFFVTTLQVIPGDSIDGGSSESFFYVNGICTTRRMAHDTGKELRQMFGRPVTVVHNPTDSVLIDIVECIFAKLWTGQSFATSRPCGLLLDQLLDALNDPVKTKVRFHHYCSCM